MNSIGSVTPVRNDVSAIDSSSPPTARRRSGARRVVHREAGGRQPEHHHREEARHEGARGGIAGEEAVEVAGHAAVVADDEPGEVVEDVVQAGDDQDAVQHAVDEEAELARAEHAAAQRVHAVLERRPAVAEGRGDDEARRSR